jgi:hypothetical protein
LVRVDRSRRHITLIAEATYVASVTVGV